MRISGFGSNAACVEGIERRPVVTALSERASIKSFTIKSLLCLAVSDQEWCLTAGWALTENVSRVNEGPLPVAVKREPLGATSAGGAGMLVVTARLDRHGGLGVVKVGRRRMWKMVPAMGRAWSELRHAARPETAEASERCCWYTNKQAFLPTAFSTPRRQRFQLDAPWNHCSTTRPECSHPLVPS